ncbi:hypothetical protein [Enterobacter bugandensis]|uniref:hypothetical protein n=1 Tax=Enterobacter bugandensis TaxID=881260 RepID=UPI0021D2BF46|nr:hypothetical protein [Enterobacter bugandensis]MCU6216071.1 hypothetical protein [Enterobacter bugandensis]
MKNNFLKKDNVIITFFILLTADVQATVLSNLTTLSPGIAMTDNVSFNYSNPGQVSVPVAQSMANKFFPSGMTTGETWVIHKFVEEETGEEKILVSCTKTGISQGWHRMTCDGQIRRFPAYPDEALMAGPIILNLNNTGTRRTKWCHYFRQPSGGWYSGCLAEFQREPCKFTTTASNVSLTTYVAGSREDQATASVSWSCPQNERPKIEILDQTYSDDCQTSNEYQDVKNASGTDIAKYRVKLEGVCNDHTPVHAMSGNITTRIYGKGVSAGTGTTSFVMRISLP